jgi:prophage antirepressor-like protein
VCITSPMSLSDAGRAKLRALQQQQPAKRPVVFKGGKEQLLEVLNGAGSAGAAPAGGGRSTDERRGSVAMRAKRSGNLSLGGGGGGPPSPIASEVAEPKLGPHCLSSVTKAVFKGKQVRYVTFGAPPSLQVLWFASDVCDTLGVPGMNKIVQQPQFQDCKQLVTIADAHSTVIDTQWTFSPQGVFRLVLRYPKGSVEFQEWVDQEVRRIERGGKSSRRGGEEQKHQKQLQAREQRLSDYGQLGLLCLDSFNAELEDGSR